jgi:hypothetical protein
MVEFDPQAMQNNQYLADLARRLSLFKINNKARPYIAQLRELHLRQALRFPFGFYQLCNILDSLDQNGYSPWIDKHLELMHVLAHFSTFQKKSFCLYPFGYILKWW